MVSSSPFLLLTCLAPALAFQVPSHSSVGITSSPTRLGNHQRRQLSMLPNDDDVNETNEPSSFNKDMMMSRRSAIAASLISPFAILASSSSVANAEDSMMYAPKFVQEYPDFTSTSEGWSYKDVKVGKDIGGGDLKDGDRVVFDWSGYTIGYFGRPFEAKGGPQGGAFDKGLDYFRTILGSKSLIPGLECSLRNMKPGGVRQVIIPYGPLSYPPEDKEHELVGPKPTTFSGMRALNFVLENPRVDRTLLFNVKLIRVDRSDGKGGFIRGEKI